MFISMPFDGTLSGGKHMEPSQGSFQKGSENQERTEM